MCDWNPETFHLPSADGLHQLAGLFTVPAEPIAIVQLVHGMAEHSGRYREVIEYLTSQGFLCVMHNHLGHKGTVRAREELGYFAPKDGDRLLIEDTHAVTRFARKKFGNTLPLLLIGHSMGSFVARLTVAAYPADYDGLAAIGTGGRQPTTAGRWLCQLLARKNGDHNRSDLVYFLVFRHYNDGFGTETSSNWLSRDRQKVQEFVDDPYCGFRFTVSAMEDLMALTGAANAEGWFRTIPKELPILLAAGACDPVGRQGKGVTEVARRLEATGHTRVTLRLYPEARHEIFNETNRSEVFSALAGWLTAVAKE